MSLIPNQEPRQNEEQTLGSPRAAACVGTGPGNCHLHSFVVGTLTMSGQHQEFERVAWSVKTKPNQKAGVFMGANKNFVHVKLSEPRPKKGGGHHINITLSVPLGSQGNRGQSRHLGDAEASVLYKKTRRGGVKSGYPYRIQCREGESLSGV